MFRRTWPSSGIIQYVQNAGEVISNIKFYEKLVYLFYIKDKNIQGVTLLVQVLKIYVIQLF